MERIVSGSSYRDFDLDQGRGKYPIPPLPKAETTMTPKFEERVTLRQICQETTLPYSTVRSIIRRAVAEKGIRPVDPETHGLGISLWRREDVAPYFTGDKT